MTTRPISLLASARRLTATLVCETGLARVGSIADLADASTAKQAAFTEFRRVCAARGEAGKLSAVEHDVMRGLLAAADENALILDAVRTTLQDMAGKLRAALRSVADPGIYDPTRRRNQNATRHVLAASLDASA